MFSKQKDEIIIKENFNIAMIYSNSCSSPNQYEKTAHTQKGVCCLVQVTGLAVCFGFALHTYGSATVAKQQYPPHRSSLKTVHRTVLLTLRPSQVQVLINMKKQHIPKRVCAVWCR